MKRIIPLFAAAAAALTAGSASAALITFDFNSISGDANINTYLNNTLAGTSATGAGVLSNNAYTGDGHVIGAVVGSSPNQTVVPATLGSTDGGLAHALSTTSPDRYLFNSGSDRITIIFDCANL